MKKFMKVLFWAVFSFGLVMAVSITAGGLYLSFTEKVDDAARGAQRMAAPVNEIPQIEENEETTLADMIEDALPSVVGISTSAAKAGEASSWYMGSGVVATDDGYIITNQHVIGSGSDKIIVTLYNGSTKEAREIWSDSALDLAVIKIDGGRFSRASFGDAEKLRVGDSVVAIGNPLSMQFERTVTAGIVSAVNRTITIDNNGVSSYMEDLIQTDASIN
ncbi:MAG: S1C family serine protease, partial [Clostridia bacterium]